MGYVLSPENFDKALATWSENYAVFAPAVFEKEGSFADTDSIRYKRIDKGSEIVFDAKSHYSFKEVLTPISEILFYFTEDQISVPSVEEKGAIILMRSCDVHSLKRLDQIYLNNGYEDFYYKRLRDRIKIFLLDCEKSFENCFCATMGTNTAEEYAAAVMLRDGQIYIDAKEEFVDAVIRPLAGEELPVAPRFVSENAVKVRIPENLSLDVMNSTIWEEYANRCIACGRCNFVCPTCTCFTMQDIFYKDNPSTGERRRVWASCHVDGYTDMAGGMKFRDNKGQRMRFKVLHKVYDFKKRFGYHMCTGCGRCDDICPEYISFSNNINRLEAAMEEVSR